MMQTLSIPPHLMLTLQQPEDAPALFLLVQQEKARLRRTLAWPDSVHQVEDSLHTIEKNRSDFFAGRSAVYLIRWQGEMAGVVAFNTLYASTGEIGYWIAERFEGQGIAYQTINTLITVYSDAGILDTFIIKASTANPRSNALAQRLGFTLVDCLPAAETIGERCYDQNRYRYHRATSGATG